VRIRTDLAGRLGCGTGCRALPGARRTRPVGSGRLSPLGSSIAVAGGGGLLLEGVSGRLSLGGGGGCGGSGSCFAGGEGRAHEELGWIVPRFVHAGHFLSAQAVH
jgi:hypothetical protein